MTLSILFVAVFSVDKVTQDDGFVGGEKHPVSYAKTERRHSSQDDDFVGV